MKQSRHAKRQVVQVGLSQKDHVSIGVVLTPANEQTGRKSLHNIPQTNRLEGKSLHNIPNKPHLRRSTIPNLYWSCLQMEAFAARRAAANLITDLPNAQSKPWHRNKEAGHPALDLTTGNNHMCKTTLSCQQDRNLSLTTHGEHPHCHARSSLHIEHTESLHPTATPKHCNAPPLTGLTAWSTQQHPNTATPRPSLALLRGARSNTQTPKLTRRASRWPQGASALIKHLSASTMP